MVGVQSTTRGSPPSPAAPLVAVVRSGGRHQSVCRPACFDGSPQERLSRWGCPTHSCGPAAPACPPACGDGRWVAERTPDPFGTRDADGSGGDGSVACQRGSPKSVIRHLSSIHQDPAATPGRSPRGPTGPLQLDGKERPTGTVASPGRVGSRLVRHRRVAMARGIEQQWSVPAGRARSTHKERSDRRRASTSMVTRATLREPRSGSLRSVR
jgi:hypothetical protein